METRIGFYVEIEFDDESQDNPDSIAIIADNLANAIIEKANGDGLADEDEDGITLAVDIFNSKLAPVHKYV